MRVRERCSSPGSTSTKRRYRTRRRLRAAYRLSGRPASCAARLPPREPRRDRARTGRSVSLSGPRRRTRSRSSCTFMLENWPMSCGVPPVVVAPANTGQSRDTPQEVDRSESVRTTAARLRATEPREPWRVGLGPKIGFGLGGLALERAASSRGRPTMPGLRYESSAVPVRDTAPAPQRSTSMTTLSTRSLRIRASRWGESLWSGRLSGW